MYVTGQGHSSPNVTSLCSSWMAGLRAREDYEMLEAVDGVVEFEENKEAMIKQ